MHQDFNALLDGYLTGTLSEADEQRFLDLIADLEHRVLLEAAIDRMAEEGSLAGEDDERLRAEPAFAAGAPAAGDKARA